MVKKYANFCLLFKLEVNIVISIPGNLKLTQI